MGYAKVITELTNITTKRVDCGVVLASQNGLSPKYGSVLNIWSYRVLSFLLVFFKLSNIYIFKPKRINKY